MPALALAPAIPLIVALMGLLIAAGLGGCLEEAADKDFKFDNPLDTTPAIPLMVALMGLLIAAGLGGCLEEAADKDFKFDNPLDTTPSDGDNSDTSGVTIAHVNTNDDVVVIVNQSATDEELQNWTLENSDQTLIYTFPQFGLTIGKFVRVRTGDGTDDSNDLFTSSAIDLDWGNGISNQNARLKNDLGTLIDACDDVDDCWN